VGWAITTAVSKYNDYKEAEQKAKEAREEKEKQCQVPKYPSNFI
jgi:hypothetical protein